MYHLSFSSLQSTSFLWLQRKRHPKDWKYLGRIRVQIKDDKGEVINNDVPSSTFCLEKTI